jgi:endonuclease G
VRKSRLIPLLGLVGLIGAAHAHPGGPGSSGCHHTLGDRGFHCHHPDQGAARPAERAPEAAPSPAAAARPGAAAVGELLRLDYEGFTVWLDCEERAAVRFRYLAGRDRGGQRRRDRFTLDPHAPKGCQQTTSKAYGLGFDRGHLVPANHLDDSATALVQSNYMTNILPQASGMNRGAWLHTEEIIECYRDLEDLLVMGGVIWGQDDGNDLFVGSHGVRTPDDFYKVVVRGAGSSQRAIAWLIPNSSDATAERLDAFLISVQELERLTGESFPVEPDAKRTRPSASWLIPMGCNKG